MVPTKSNLWSIGLALGRDRTKEVIKIPSVEKNMLMRASGTEIFVKYIKKHYVANPFLDTAQFLGTSCT